MGKKSRKKKDSKKKQVKPSQSKQLPVIIVVILMLSIGGYFFYTKYFADVPVTQARESATANVPVTQTLASEKFEDLRAGEDKATLNPSRFIGQVAKGYRIAQENRELLDSIYCYCRCKENMGHKSLLTCYTNTHAANCNICLNQAFYAYNLYKKGHDFGQVREAVDKKFWRPLS
jgi:hypothetical protein